MTTNSNNTSLDLNAIRARLSGSQGQQLWRSLDELADTDEFRELVEREFPQGAAEMTDPVSRRTFLKLMGASLALAGISGCTYQPRQYIAPYANAPAGWVPNVPVFYASTFVLNGYGSGVLVKSLESRPIKIEGNAAHPASLGATDVFAQASLLTMYDPDRSQLVLKNGQASTWEDFTAELQNALSVQETSQGAGLRILTETVTSPTMADQLNQLLTTYPRAKWYQYEPVNRTNSHKGAQLAFGEDVDTLYDFSQTKVVVSLDADFMSPGPGYVPYSRAFTNGRKVSEEHREMNRLYVVESTPSTTGATADHRIPLQAHKIDSFARALAQRLGVGSAAGAEFTEHEEKMLDVIAHDLEEHRGANVVLVGEHQPPELHALVHAINDALGNVGSTVNYIEPVEVRPADHYVDIADLTSEINAGLVEMLVIIGGNPVFNAPADLRFDEQLESVNFSVHLSLYVDETSSLATWHIPAAHFLESWSDARAFDGTASLVQPLIEPLYAGKTVHEIFAEMLGQSDQSNYEIVQTYWQSQLDAPFEEAWHNALSLGLFDGTASPVKTVTLQGSAVGEFVASESEGIEVVFRPDPSIWDGSFANNGWLQELPKPQTKLTWDNAALMSPHTAIGVLGLNIADPNNPTINDYEGLALSNGQMIDLDYRGGKLRIPVWITPGMPEDSITLYLGYGRSKAGRVGDGVGFNTYALRTSDAPWFGSGAEVTNAGERYSLVSTQDHWILEDRDASIYRVGNLKEFAHDPEYLKHEIHHEEFGDAEHEQFSLHPNAVYKYNAWGVVINLNACNGCNVCVIACQAENNIPVVGKAQVAVGREMHWLRIDRYYSGDFDNPATYLQPMACYQCEQAPCEVVCPVAATNHDREGINNMVYNRCVGTKYCSNNCPYKVRRFNFIQYTDIESPSLKLMYNPDVTVRNRGVMEKCTYCVQRISAARIEAKERAVQQGDPEYIIEDGAIVMACEAACPTEAITFGDLNNPESRVSKLRAEPINYGVLTELNTKPRTTYLARINNPNAELETE